MKKIWTIIVIAAGISIAAITIQNGQIYKKL
jgi:hypothetical protein